MDADLRMFLWRACAFPGDSTEVLPPTIATEVHWTPYLVDSPTPEELLKDAAFDCFRCDPRQPAHVFYYEASPPAAAQERYARTVLLRNGRSAPDEARRAASVRYRVPDSSRPPPVGAVEALAVFATNYVGTSMGRANLAHKHTPAQRACMLYMNLHFMNAAMAHLWSAEMSALVDQCVTGPDRKMTLCALADAVMCGVLQDYHWLARVASMADYNAHVKRFLKEEAVRRVTLAPPHALRDLSPDDEARLLGVRTDAELEQFRSVLFNAVH